MRAFSNAPPLIQDTCTKQPLDGCEVQDPGAHIPGLGGDGCPQAWIDAMDSLLHEQEGLLTSLAVLSGRQAECISAGLVDDLLNVLGSRQELVTRFLEVQADLVGLKKVQEAQDLAIDPDVQDRLHERMHALDQLLQGVLEQDDRDHTQLLQQRVVVEQHVNHLDAGVRARERYASLDNHPAITDADRGARA